MTVLGKVSFVAYPTFVFEVKGRYIIVLRTCRALWRYLLLGNFPSTSNERSLASISCLPPGLPPKSGSG